MSHTPRIISLSYPITPSPPRSPFYFFTLLLFYLSMPFPVYIAALGLLFLVLFSAEYLLSLVGIIRFDPYYLMWPLLAVACFVTALLWFGLASLMRYASRERRQMRAVVRAAEAAMGCRAYSDHWWHVLFVDTSLNISYSRRQHNYQFFCSFLQIPPTGAPEWFDAEMQALRQRLAELSADLSLDTSEPVGMVAAVAVTIPASQLTRDLVAPLCRLLNDVHARSWHDNYYIHMATDKADFYAEVDYSVCRAVFRFSDGRTLCVTPATADEAVNHLPEELCILLDYTAYDLSPAILISRAAFEQQLPADV